MFTHNNQDETILQDVERFSLDFDLPQENETAPGPWLNQTSGKIVSAISQKVSSRVENSPPYWTKEQGLATTLPLTFLIYIYIRVEVRSFHENTLSRISFFC